MKDTPVPTSILPSSNRASIYRYHSSTLDFEALLKTVDIVSFDLFDTLIYRPGLFSPKDLFYEVQKRSVALLGEQSALFPAARVHAEERARVIARGQGLQEVCFDDIYRELGRILRVDTTVLVQIKQIELDCERIALTALESGKNLFQAAIDANKKVIVVSDMYLDTAFIEGILQQQGFSAADKIYISSAYGCSKADGSLYDLVVSDVGCRPSKILHVGDNQLADVTMALSRGLRTYFVPTTKQYMRWRHGLGDRPSGNLVMSSILSELSTQPAENTTGGSIPDVQPIVQQMAILYFGFATWLLSQLRVAGYRRVYFAARDGLIIKRCFDLVATMAGERFDTRYLMISRAALYPTLLFTDPIAARQIFAHSWDYLTIEEALIRLRLRFEDVAGTLMAHGFRTRRQRLTAEYSKEFQQFLTQIWPHIESVHREQYHLATAYLHQEEFLTSEPAAFVDIGWHGSLQNSLLKLLHHARVQKDLGGYYLGTFSQPEGVALDFKAQGFLCNNGDPAPLTQLVRAGPSLIELLHSANHGSVYGYEQIAEKIAPICEKNSAEVRQYAAIIAPLQEQALQYITHHMTQSPGSTLNSVDPAIVAHTALRMIYNPTAAEAEMLGSLQISSDFGSQMKSITGTLEWNLAAINDSILPNGLSPMWQPGFQVLRKLQRARL